MIKVEINSIDRSSLIDWQSLIITKNLTSLVDTFTFNILDIDEDLDIDIADEVEIYLDTNKIFGGRITRVEEELDYVDGKKHRISGQDYSYDLSSRLVARSFVGETGGDIISNVITEFAPDFTTTNVNCDVSIAKIVFNQVSVSDCLTRISSIIGYEWFVDENKDIHFFERFSLSAPFNLTDTSGNYVYKSLKKTIDGSQIANQVKVRGGMGTETSLFEDTITVNGNETLSFKLPYKFANLSVFVDSGTGFEEKIVGIDNIDEFTSVDVLYNYQAESIRFEAPLNDGDEIKFSGNKKFPVMAIVEDTASVSEIGLREKLIVDNTLENTSTARERASLELELGKDAIKDCSFRTYTSGLEPGMKISIGSTNRRVSELDYIITKISFRTRTPDSFEYHVDTSTARKVGLTEFLKGLARRDDAFREDENEVAEIVKKDNQGIVISEDITRIFPEEDTAEIEITEDFRNTDVEPLWVLAPYVPDNIEDTKRMGRLNRSFKLY